MMGNNKCRKVERLEQNNPKSDNEVKFIIQTPAFDFKLGGVIALHRLCHLLRQQGVPAYLWPGGRPILKRHEVVRSIARFVKYFFKFAFGKRFLTYSGFDTPVARYADLKNAVAVYGESVKGNPLNAEKVIRWFLHKPGFHTGTVQYGENELYFFYNRSFCSSLVELPPDNQLRVMHIMDDVYKQTNFGVRTGRCYIVRKGSSRADLPDLSNEIVIDNLSHEEIAQIFNSVEYCVSYDLYTMYSRYAVMCGCISIVVPEGNVTKEQWCPNEEDTYGLGYGFSDEAYALHTRDALLSLLAKEKETERKMVADFVDKTKDHFHLI